jgi:hypothetical protein
MKTQKKITEILLLTIIILAIGCLNSFGQESSSKRIKVGMSVTPDIYNPTIKFYMRKVVGDEVGKWILVATKGIEKKDRGKSSSYFQYVDIEENEYFEIKAIVSHPDYKDCDTGSVKFDYNSNGGVRINDGPCCMMHAKYRK